MLARRLVTSSLLLFVVSSRAGAQELAPDVVRQISAASVVRVTLADGGRRTLYHPAVDAGGLAYSDTLGLGNHRHVEPAPPLPMAQVTRIQVPGGSHARGGATVGGILGLGLGILGVREASAEDSWVSPTPGEAVGAMMITTALGAGVGALIGAAMPRWNTVYVSGGP